MRFHLYGRVFGPSKKKKKRSKKKNEWTFMHFQMLSFDPRPFPD